MEKVKTTWYIWPHIVSLINYSNGISISYSKQSAHYAQPQSTHRVAMTIFWRTFHHNGKISPALRVWGRARPPPFTLSTITHCYKRYLKWSPPLENCSSGNGKRPRWCRNILSLGHTGILHSSMLEMSSGMEECKITAWARNILSLAHAGILHSSMPEMSEES